MGRPRKRIMADGSSSEKPVLRIRFCDFHRRLPQSQDYFERILRQRYQLDFESEPSFVLFSNYGREHTMYDCVRIFYSMENERPGDRVCDFSMTFDHCDDSSHLRVPYYLMHADLAPLLPRWPQGISRSALLAIKTEFCCFIHSNPFGSRRNQFFRRLSRVKKVASAGRYRNNVGQVVGDKLQYMRRFKFAFAFENEGHPGYTTEKLTDAFLAGAVPIYWGNPRVAEEFNSRAMLCRHDFSTDEKFIQRILEVDANDELFLDIVSQPAFVGNRLPDQLSDASVLEFLERAFSASRSANNEVRQPTQVNTPRQIVKRARRLARHSVKGIRLVTGI